MQFDSSPSTPAPAPSPLVDIAWNWQPTAENPGGDGGFNQSATRQKPDKNPSGGPKTDRYLDDTSRIDGLVQFIAAHEIDGRRLVFDKHSEDIRISESGMVTSLDALVWPNLCNIAVSLMEGAEHTYNRISASDAKNLAKRILLLYRNKKLNLTVVDIKEYDTDTKEAALSFNEKLRDIGERIGFDMEMYPLTGLAAHKILGMKGSRKSRKILECAGWKKVHTEIGTVWITKECPVNRSNYKEYMFTESSLDNERLNRKQSLPKKLPNDPTKLTTTGKQSSREGDDEFYTMMEYIIKELSHYKGHFKGKTIFCNCDDYRKSHFYNYFRVMFEPLGIKKLISCCLDGVVKIITSDGSEEYTVVDGSYMGSDSIELLKECDIVVTNPPFSTWSEFLELLYDHEKKFLILGCLQSIKGEIAKKMMKNDEMWLGTAHGPNMSFSRPNGSVKKVELIRWFTNLSHDVEPPELELECRFDPEKYHKIIEKYPDAINVNYVKDIPKNYDGLMAVPITFCDYGWSDFRLVDIIGDATIDGVEKKKQRVIIQRIR